MAYHIKYLTRTEAISAVGIDAKTHASIGVDAFAERTGWHPAAYVGRNPLYDPAQVPAALAFMEKRAAEVTAARAARLLAANPGIAALEVRLAKAEKEITHLHSLVETLEHELGIPRVAGAKV